MVGEIVARTKAYEAYRKCSILQSLSHSDIIFRAHYMTSVGYGGADSVVNGVGEEWP